MKGSNMIQTPTTPSSSSSLCSPFRGESTVPIKKRMLPADINHSPGNYSSFMAPPSSIFPLNKSVTSSLSLLASNHPNITSTTSSVNYDIKLNEWQKHRVLALRISSATNDLTYHTATIEHTNGTLVTVSFENSNLEPQNSSTTTTNNLINNNYNNIHTLNRPQDSDDFQHTYDVGKEDEKYALIDDSQPSADKLEKDMFVLYRCQLTSSASSSNSSTSSSYPSTPTPTPTTPTSPSNTGNRL